MIAWFSSSQVEHHLRVPPVVNEHHATRHGAYPPLAKDLYLPYVW